MRVVVDTNVVISGVFFGGAPRRVVEVVVDSEIEASATSEIVDEYSRVVERMIERKGGRLRGDAFSVLVSKLEVIEAVTRVEACRDPDEDKFIGCAIDARAIYIVSGDRDLLDMGSYQGVEMVTAAEFCERYLK